MSFPSANTCTDYKKAAQLIKDGGYATSSTYVEKLCSIIERWSLTQYDVKAESKDSYYRVRKSWEDAKSQLGAYKVLANAKKCADKNPGYTVYDPNGKAVYPAAQNEAAMPFCVKVSIDDKRGTGSHGSADLSAFHQRPFPLCYHKGTGKPGYQVTFWQRQMAHQHGEIDPYQREVPRGCAPAEAVHHGLPAEEEEDQQRRNPPVLCGGTP